MYVDRISYSLANASPGLEEQLVFWLNC